MIASPYMGLFPITVDTLTNKIFLEGTNIEMEYQNRKLPKRHREMWLKLKCWIFGEDKAAREKRIDEAFEDPSFFEIRPVLSPVDEGAFNRFYYESMAKQKRGL